MNMKKMVRVFLWVLMIYLFISGIYVLHYIDYSPAPLIVGPGYSESKNIIRVIMGIPKTFTTYEGVSPWFMIEVVLKMVATLVLLLFLLKNKKEK